MLAGSVIEFDPRARQIARKRQVHVRDDVAAFLADQARETEEAAMLLLELIFQGAGNETISS